MPIYSRNIPAKFHPDPIRNNGALGFYFESRLLKTPLHFEELGQGRNPLHQFFRSKSVTIWRGQKSVV